MQTTLRLTVPVLPGKRIEVVASELPEQGDVDLVIYLPQAQQGEIRDGNYGNASRYPKMVEDEYARLISIEEVRALTRDESDQLEQVKAEINLIDVSTVTATSYLRGLAKIADHLSALRRDLEALPDSP
jgi:hypothetical protein